MAVRACDTLAHLLARLDSTARLTLAHPDGVLERVQGLPGVKSAAVSGGKLAVTTADLPPLLPKLLAAAGEVTALDIEQPTLERVFLTLTGRGLRD
ncbi:MAG: hypothetical protein ABGY75_21635 [Gemmataceae bacterium]